MNRARTESLCNMLRHFFVRPLILDLHVGNENGSYFSNRLFVAGPLIHFINVALLRGQSPCLCIALVFYSPVDSRRPFRLGVK